MSDSKTVRFTVEDNIIYFNEMPENENESLIKEARIFYVGKHKGREYSEEDLQKIADNFNPDESIPVQLDHSTSAHDTVGVVENIEKRGNELFAKLRFLGRAVVEKVKLGLWKKVSVGLSLKEPAMKLIEVSITPFPALADAQVFTEKEREKEGVCNEGASLQMDSQQAFIDFAFMKVEFDRLKAERDELESRMKFNEDRELIDGFVRAGRTTPAARDAEIRLLHSLDKDQRIVFLEYKEKMPLLIDFKTYNTHKPRKPGEISDEEAKNEAEELLKFTSVSKLNK